ncbi:MAG: spondin domain-containing protein [Psychromonas sp.]
MNKTNFLIVSAFSLTTFAAAAAEIDVTVQNTTHAMYFTPLIIAAHAMDASIFTSGQAASSELQAMAEGGDISGLESLLSGTTANTISNPAPGLLIPGAAATATLSTDSANQYLSLSAMILPTNDGFVGLDSWKIPEEAGTYTIKINAYDAGTEANNEIVSMGSGAPGVLGIPAAPGMDAGTGGLGVTTSESNATVHIHRGNLGDDDIAGGNSDLSNTVHRWLNPVATVTVVVK